MKELMIGSSSSSLSNFLIILNIFPILQLKISARDGFVMDNLDDDDIIDDNDNIDINDDIVHDLLFTSSEIIDVNNITEIPNIIILNQFTQFKGDIIINIIIDSKILNQYDYDIYFTSTFSILFPYDIGKYRDLRREIK